MPTPVLLTPPQRRVLDYLRGLDHPIGAASVAASVYGSSRTGTANALRILEGLAERGLVRQRGKAVGPILWAVTAKGSRA